MFVYSDVEDEQCRGYGFCVTSVTWLSWYASTYWSVSCRWCWSDSQNI